MVARSLVLTACAFLFLEPISVFAAAAGCPFPARTPVTKNEWKIYFIHEASAVHQQYDLNCDGKLGPDELAALQADAEGSAEEDVASVERLQSEGHSITLDANGKTVPPIHASAELDPKLPTGGGFLLRDSFEDISIFSRPKSFQKASGATFSWSRDGTIDNSVWSAKGVMSYAFTHFNDPPDPGIPYAIGYALAPSISFNRTANSSPARKSKDVDFLGFSATGEIGYADGNGSANYFRLRPNYITDFDGNGKSWSIVGEWQPYLDTPPFRLSDSNDLGPIIWQLDPILRVQYAHELNNSGDPIFDNNDAPFRLGPVLSLTIQPTGFYDLPEKLQNAALYATYQWLDDVETGDSSYLFTAGLNVNLDDDGHTALKFSYSKGQLEETGDDVDLIQVGLAAKW